MSIDVESILRHHRCVWCNAEPGQCQCREELEARIAESVAKRQRWEIRQDRHSSAKDLRIYPSFELWINGEWRGSLYQGLGIWHWHALSPEGAIIGKGHGRYRTALQDAWACYKAAEEAQDAG